MPVIFCIPDPPVGGQQARREIAFLASGPAIKDKPMFINLFLWKLLDGGGNITPITPMGAFNTAFSSAFDIN